ncbi:MAG TPA: metallophosphoesterase [Candidatus Krumholzibacteria bacterium]|nr:metallophosphoesterase [Candidatus Krumholzibacteria bacterium]HPD70322.1 metallophosphoesterase [Candidatus Krumholzibacteria bacterium]HRY39978.1 metallophosphoesterase [Candidatus Krumholzibacteria bacterium]
MRLLLLSDLHLEFADFAPPAVDADLVLLAGDISTGTAGVAWAAAAFGDRPVVYVPGNHEYYGEAFPRHLGALRRAAKGTGVRVLDRGVLELDSVRILGCTLWTDFDLHGDSRAARALAAERMWDYREIRISPRLRAARPRDTLRWHRRARAWLARELAGANARTVVVTHHAPSAGSVSVAPDDQPFSPAYASNLEALITTSGPALWLHGHIHRARDYRLGGTRVVCNPRGYPGQHTGFDVGFTVDL